jgi:predicted outer membrane repeat protein
MRCNTCGRILVCLCTIVLLLVLSGFVIAAEGPALPGRGTEIPQLPPNAPRFPGSAPGHPRKQDGLQFFVKPDGGGTACTQASPCSLSTALSLAGDNDQVNLAAGTYRGTGAAVVTLDHSIMLWGGWDGQPTGQPYFDSFTYGSILDGENQRRVVFVNPSLSVAIGGVAILYGSATDRGAGLYARDADVTLVLSTIGSNTVDSRGAGDTRGGGMYVEGGTLQMVFDYVLFNVARCSTCDHTIGGGIAVVDPVSVSLESVYFWRNSAWFGGGLDVEAEAGTTAPAYVSGSAFEENGRDPSSGATVSTSGGAASFTDIAAVVRDSQFLSNTASSSGGAIHSGGGSLLLESCYLAGNEALFGAAVDAAYGTADLINNVIAHNAVRAWGGAVDWYQVEGTLIHNTLARNVGPEGGTGVALYSGCVAKLLNNILVGHTTGIALDADSSASLDATLWGSGAWANGTDWTAAGSINTGTRNLWADPRFLRPAAGDYHLDSSSPAIDAGLESGVFTDLDGDPRPAGAGYDLGADERGAYACMLPVVRRR